MAKGSNKKNNKKGSRKKTANSNKYKNIQNEQINLQSNNDKNTNINESNVVIEEDYKKNSFEKEEAKKITIDKARKNLVYANNDSSDEFSKLFKIVLIVTAIIAVFYLVTVVVTRKANAIKTARKEESEEVIIQYDNVIVGSMLKIDGSFYVLIEDEDDKNIAEYQTLLQTIAANDDASKIYVATLSNSFNKIYLANESNYDSDLSKFRVTGSTLVQVSNHEIVSVFDTYDSIKSELNNLQ